MLVDEKHRRLRELIRAERPGSEDVFDILSFYAVDRRPILYQYIELLLDKADLGREQLVSLGKILDEAADYWRYGDRSCEEYSQGAGYCSELARGEDET